MLRVQNKLKGLGKVKGVRMGADRPMLYSSAPWLSTHEGAWATFEHNLKRFAESEQPEMFGL